MKIRKPILHFPIKLLILSSRMYIEFIGMITLFSGISYPIFAKDYRYLPNILVGLIFIFPFRLLKKIPHLFIYFNFLWPTSLLLLIDVIGKYSQYTHPIPTFYVDSSLLILNCISVYFYILHKKNLKFFNPYFGFKNLLTLLLIVLLLFTSIFFYLFWDIHQTRDGTKWFNLLGLTLVTPYSSEKQWVEPVYTNELFHSKYVVSYSNTSPGDQLSITIKMPLSETVDIYENNRKIIQIQLINKLITGVSTLQSDNFFSRPVYMLSYKRLPSGGFVPTYQEDRAKSQGAYNLWIEIGYISPNENNYVHQLHQPGDMLGIKIIKSINYPRKIPISIFPFGRKKENWEISIGDSEGVVKLLNGYQIWFK